MKIKRNYINWFLVVFWMAIIFMFSSQPADVSNQNNKLVINLFANFGVNFNSIFGQLANFLVRKAAHLIEYFILFLLVHNAIRCRKEKCVKNYLISIFIIFLYACSDEFHQAFVPGRAPAFRDIMVDVSGGILALIISWVYHMRKKYCSLKKSD